MLTIKFQYETDPKKIVLPEYTTVKKAFPFAWKYVYIIIHHGYKCIRNRRRCLKLGRLPYQVKKTAYDIFYLFFFWINETISIDTPR